MIESELIVIREILIESGLVTSAEFGNRVALKDAEYDQRAAEWKEQQERSRNQE